jgi:hypothetical protein
VVTRFRDNPLGWVGRSLVGRNDWQRRQTDDLVHNRIGRLWTEAERRDGQGGHASIHRHDLRHEVAAGEVQCPRCGCSVALAALPSS